MYNAEPDLPTQQAWANQPEGSYLLIFWSLWENPRRNGECPLVFPGNILNARAPGLGLCGSDGFNWLSRCD